MSSDTLLAPGTIVSGYEIDSLLGQGGMAVVYRATQRSLKRTVALKLLSNELSASPEFRERFEREGQLQAAIDHLHIVPVYEAGQSEHGLFLAMRLIAGPTLKHLIENRELDARRTLRLLAQVAQALDAAHAAGLIHRDVKPQNILVGEQDHAYLADFGLIKAPDEVRLTDTGQFMGTIDYVAPEQIRGEQAGPATDCYALTAVLFECLTGEVPFPKPTEAAVLQAQLAEPPPKVSERRPDLPVELDELIARGMAKNPANRPLPTMDLMRAAFQSGVASGGGGPNDAPTRQRAAVGGQRRFEVTRAQGVIGDIGADASAEAIADVRTAETIASAQTAEAAAATPAAGSRWTLIIGLAVFAAVAIVAGYLVGHSGKSSTPSHLTPASAGSLALSYPAGWQQLSSATTVPGITFSQPLSLTTTGGGTLTAGQVDASGPTLLPAAFIRAITAPSHGTAPAPQHVLLGSVQAYRYQGLSVQGLSQPATVYVAPTTAGVATIVCTGPAGATAHTSFADRCGQVAATLRLRGASGYPLTPSASYARLLSSTLTSLRTSAAASAHQLGAATTPSAQAVAARHLADAYIKAAAVLSKASLSPLDRAANASLVSALHGVAAGYTSAAGAAAANSSSGYAHAGQQLHQANAAVASAVHSLGALGYHVT